MAKRTWWSRGPAYAREDGRSVGTWGASPQQPSTSDPSHSGLTDQTERAVVHLSVGGRAVRVRVSNVFGGAPVTFNEVDVALRASGAALVAGSSRRATFGGRRSVTIAAGREALSDPVGLVVRPQQDLAVSLFSRGATGPATFHALGVASSFLT